MTERVTKGRWEGRLINTEINMRGKKNRRDETKRGAAEQPEEAERRSSWVACQRRAELFCLLTFPILTDGNGDRKRARGGREEEKQALCVCVCAGRFIESCQLIA